MVLLRALTWCAVAPLVVRGQTGQTTCPCLVARPTTAPSSLTITYVNGAGASATHTFPSNYGLGACQAWDDGEAPQCLQADPPAWCAAAWCYVGDDCAGSTALWDAEHGGGVLDSWFPDSGLRRSYATCGTPTYLAHHSKIDLSTLTADSLITLIDNYLIAIRDTVESTQQAINTETLDAVSRRCDAPVDNCNCTACSNTTRWENGTKSVDLTQVGFSTRDMSALNSFDESEACVVRGQLEGHFQAIGQQVYDNTARVGEMQYTWANLRGGLTMVYPAQQYCPTQRDFRFDSEYVFASTGPKDVMVLMSASKYMVGQKWDRALVMIRRLLDSLTEFDFIGLAMYGRFVSGTTDLPATSYEPTEIGLADGLSPGKIARRATPKVKEDIMRWINTMVVDNQAPIGKEDWYSGFVEIAKVIRTSRKEQQTSFCQTPLLFFSAELDENKMESYFYKEEFDEFQPQPILMMFAMHDSEIKGFDWHTGYSAVQRDLACAMTEDDERTGVFLPVPDSHDLGDYFLRYSFFLAHATENRNNVRYSKRFHQGTGAEVLTACLPAYEKRKYLDRELAGVVCIDVDLVVPLEDLKNNASATFDYDEFVKKFVLKSAQCEPFQWQESIKTSMNTQCTLKLPDWMWVVVFGASQMMVFCLLYLCYKKRKEIVHTVRTSRSVRMISTMGRKSLGSRSLSIAGNGDKNDAKKEEGH